MIVYTCVCAALSLFQVQGLLGGNASPEAVLCCFLVYIGVDMDTPNYNGSRALEMCEPVLAVTIASFAEEHKGYVPWLHTGLSSIDFA